MEDHGSHRSAGTPQPLTRQGFLFSVRCTRPESQSQAGLVWHGGGGRDGGRAPAAASHLEAARTVIQGKGNVKDFARTNLCYQDVTMQGIGVLRARSRSRSRSRESRKQSRWGEKESELARTGKTSQKDRNKTEKKPKRKKRLLASQKRGKRRMKNRK